MKARLEFKARMYMGKESKQQKKKKEKEKEKDWEEGDEKATADAIRLWSFREVFNTQARLDIVHSKWC